MPDLKKITEQTKTIPVKLVGETLRITYKPFSLDFDQQVEMDDRARRADKELVDAQKAYEEATESDMAGAEARLREARENGFTVQADLILMTVVDWDLTDSGVKLPVDRSSLRKAIVVVPDIFNAIRRDRGEARGGRSGSGS